MSDKMNWLFYGSVLHDIGKALQRAENIKKQHGPVGADYLKTQKVDYRIVNEVEYHMYAQLKDADLEKDNLAYISYIADNIAAGTDRRAETKTDYSNWDKSLPLSDIFNRFGDTKGKRSIKPGVMNPENIAGLAPVNEKGKYNAIEYSKAIAPFKQTFPTLQLTEDNSGSMLNLLEATMSQMPSSVNADEESDISLYDHLRLTAAFAGAIKQYLDSKDITNYKDELYKHAKEFYKKSAFLMVGYEFSGVENFVYTITSQGAHKQLRSRAFYTEMLAQWFIDSLLKEMDLTEVNLLYKDSQHSYFIIGNTEVNVTLIKRKQEEFNKFLLNNYGIKLYMSIGWEPFSANEVMGKDNAMAPKEKYAELFSTIDKKIQKENRSKYDAQTIIKLNKAGKKSGRECSICHSVSSLLADENKCVLCQKLEDFSSNIQNEKYFVIDQDSNGLPLNDQDYLNTVSEDRIKNGKVDGFIYAKNEFMTGLNQATYLWVSDYSFEPHNNYSYYAERSWNKEEGLPTGIKRLGTLMIDVDDLRAKFLSGFHEQAEGKFTTIGRYATLSRRINLFFKYCLNEYSKEYRVSIIYSQNGSAFLLGAWDDILALTLDLNDYFENWTDGKLTFSAGIGIFNAKTPINVMARKTNELLKEAKYLGKDRICLFSRENTFTFDDFEDIEFKKLTTIRDFFDNQDQHGKAFIYKLLDLIRQRDEEDRISFARMAYFLTRLENSSNDKKSFNMFKKKMMNWFSNKDEIHKTEVALMLYVYEIREDD